MALEDGPGEPVVFGSGVVAVAWEESAEVDGAAKKKDVVLVAFGHGGLVEHGGAETRRSINSTVAVFTLLPAVEAGIRRCGAECTALEGRKVTGSLALYGGLVVVLKVGANTREIDDHWDVEFLEFVSRADTAKLEDLGGVLDEVSKSISLI